MELSERQICWIAFAVSVVLAAVGVVWYAETQDFASYQASSLLTLPLVLIVCVWPHARLPLRIQWIGAIALALVGPIGYAVVGGDQWWNWGQLAPVPLLLLMVSQAARSESDGTWSGSMGAGPWGPP
jgi:hypothetical protein